MHIRNSFKQYLFLFAFVFSLMTFFAGICSAQERKLIPFEPGDSLEEIREKIRINGFKFEVKPTWVFELPQSQREKMRSRRAPRAEQMRSASLLPYIRLAPQALPSSFDLRNYNGRSYVGPIHDQGSIGTCFAFSAAATAEGTYNLATQRFGDDAADFSESYIAWTLSSYSPYGSHFDADGADYDYYELLALTSPGAGTGYEGIPDEEDFPYQQARVTSAMKSESTTKPRITFDTWSRIYPDEYTATTEEIKNAILTNGAVDAAILAGSAFDAYASGVYEDTNTGTAATPYYYSPTNHAISLVGWDDNPPEGGGGVWILRNSWGASWGESGYMRIRYFSARVNTSAAILLYHNTLPVAVTGEATTVTANSAVLNGSVNPANGATTYYFEYGSTPALGSFTTSVDAGSGDTTASVSAAISGLQPQLTYYYRLTAENPAGTRHSAVRTFTTSGSPALPLVQTGAASDADVDSVMLNGSINPRGASADYYVEYGPTAAYGLQTTSAELPSITLNAGVQVMLNTLQPATVYHYRFVASNAVGTVYGEDRIFTTPGVMLAEDFETAVPSAGWQESVVSQSGGSAPDWTLFQEAMCAGSDVTCQPYDGSGMGRFNSYQAGDSSKSRLVLPVFNFSGKGNIKLSYWMYHNSRYANPDHLQVQVSTDGAAWLNTGDRCLRYAVSEQWERCTVTLDYLAGESTAYVALLGVSGYGDNVYIDDLRLTAEDTYSVSGRVTENGAGVSGVVVTLSGETPRTAVTGDGGTYVFAGVLNGDYSLAPSRKGYTFSPESRTTTVAGGNRTDLDFTTVHTSFAVSGTVQGGGTTLGEVRLTLVPAGSETPLYQTTSAADGSFSFSDVANGQYRVYAELNGTIIAQQQVEVQGDDLSLSVDAASDLQLGTEVAAFWNGNLGMTNVLEVANKSAEPLTVTVALLNSDGVNESSSTASLTLGGYEQRDIVLNELDSFTPGAYGLLQATLSHGEADGRVSFYRPSGTGAGWDYAFSLPLTGPLYSAAYAASNTYPPESGGAVTNWLSVANLSASSRSFAVNYYNIAGELVNVRTVSLPPFGRRDIDGGHEAFGAFASGLIEIEPEAADVPYLASLARYGKKTAQGDDYNFAFAAPVLPGNSLRQVLPVSAGPDSLNYIELANTSGEDLGIALEYFDADGRNVESRHIDLGGHEQQHLLSGIPTNIPFSGSVHVQPSRAASLLAGSATYYYGSGLTTLLSAEYSTALTRVTPRRTGSFNLYLGMANWLRVVNTSSSMFTVMLNLDCGLSSERVIPLTVPAQGRLDFGLHERDRFGLSADSYGQFWLETPQPQESYFQLLRVLPASDGTIDALSTIEVR